MAKKTKKHSPYDLPDMPTEVYAELLCDAIESIHRLPIRHHLLRDACRFLEIQLDQITIVSNLTPLFKPTEPK